MIIKQIGVCGVDSGQLLIIDPCYLKDWKDGEFLPEVAKVQNSYDEVCKITCNTNGSAGETSTGGVVLASGYGDGAYPVIAHYNKDGRIVKIVVDMEE